MYVIHVIPYLFLYAAVVALSTSEAEYIALSSAAQEAIWLNKLLTELGISTECVKLMEDN